MKRVGAVLFMATIFAAPAALAGSITLWDGFPDTQGDKGFYAYAYNGSTYRQLTDTGAYYFSTPEQPWAVPIAFRESSPWVFLHPSGMPQGGTVYGAEDAVLAYLVPETGFYTLTGSFWLNGSGGISAYVKAGGSVLFSQSLGLDELAPFSLGVSLQRGDFAYFGVNARGADYDDWGHVSGEISWTSASAPVPEPSAMLLLGAGVAGLLGARIRMKNL